MSNPVQVIPLERLALTFLPVLVVLGILYRWSLDAGTGLYAMGRMLLQLLLIGYVLTAIFTSESAGVVGLVLAGMLAIASWIALRPLHAIDRWQYLKALGSIALGGVLTLLLVTQVVLEDQSLLSAEQGNSARRHDLRAVDDGDQPGGGAVLRRA